MEPKKNQKKKLPPIAHDLLIVMVIGSIFRFILKHVIIAGMIFAFSKFGMYNRGFIADVAITIAGIWLSRRIFNDIVNVLNNESEEKASIFEVIDTIKDAKKQWKAE